MTGPALDAAVGSGRISPGDDRSSTRDVDFRYTLSTVSELESIEEEVNHYRRQLLAMIRATGLTVVEVERRLELGERLLQRVLSGRRDLRLRHVLMVLKVLGVRHEDFFRAAAPPQPAQSAKGTGVLEMLASMGFRGRRQELEGAPASAEELQRMVDEAVDQALERREREAREHTAADAEPETTGDGKAGGARSGGPPPHRPPAGKKPKR
jgi:hypothetical protein